MDSHQIYGPPFKNFSKVWVVAPSEFSSLNDIEKQQSQGVRKLIEEHRGAIERELGCPFEFTDKPKAEGAHWLIGPGRCNPAIGLVRTGSVGGPTIFLDRKLGLLITDGPSPEEVTETYSYLRSLGRWSGGTWQIEDCKTVGEAVERIYNEVKTTYPSFKLRGLDWDAISDRFMEVARQSNDPIPIFQKWLATLQDSHTWVRPYPPFGSFSYDLVLQGKALKFYRVAEGSAAWNLGVRPGFELEARGIEDWAERTSGSEHSKPYVIGARYLATKMGELRSFRAISPDGVSMTWEEYPTMERWQPLVSWKSLKSGNGYLKIQAFILGKGMEEQLDQALSELKGATQLIIDMRGHTGGNLLMAHRFRNRFLHEDGIMGWIQNTLPDGSLSPREPILGNPAPLEKRWLKPAIFLTDPLTYSASEDVLLGLQGLSHIKVCGSRSGGGSGRVRILRLLPGWRLTISTALTYDLAGHCVEGHGIPVDIEHPPSFDPAELINMADKIQF